MPKKLLISFEPKNDLLFDTTTSHASLWVSGNNDRRDRIEVNFPIKCNVSLRGEQQVMFYYIELVFNAWQGEEETHFSGTYYSISSLGKQYEKTGECTLRDKEPKHKRPS